MKNKGFIVVAEYHPNDPDHAKETDLHVEAIIDGNIAPDDETTTIVSVWISELNSTLEFTRNEAKDFMTAMGVIVDRYEITPEEWEAKYA